MNKQKFFMLEKDNLYINSAFQYVLHTNFFTMIFIISCLFVSMVDRTSWQFMFEIIVEFLHFIRIVHWPHLSLWAHFEPMCKVTYFYVQRSAYIKYRKIIHCFTEVYDGLKCGKNQSITTDNEFDMKTYVIIRIANNRLLSCQLFDSSAWVYYLQPYASQHSVCSL